MHDTPPNHPATPALFGMNALYAFSWAGNMAALHGLSWQLVPPILMGAASFVIAVNTAINDREKRRVSRAERMKRSP